MEKGGLALGGNILSSSDLEPCLEIIISDHGTRQETETLRILESKSESDVSYA